MQFVSGHLQNKRILIQIGVRRFDDDPRKPVDLHFHEFTALVDTGASRTAISQNVIDRVELTSRGQIPVGNVKRTEMHDQFLFYIGIFPDRVGDKPSAVFGVGDAILGIDGGDSRYYDVLLGMDIISRGVLQLDLDGSFRIGFPG